MTKSMALKAMEAKASGDGSKIVWTMRNSEDESFEFVMPAQNLAPMVMGLLLVATESKVGNNAKPTPKLTGEELAKAPPLPILSVGTFVAPATYNVGFDLELTGAIRLVFQLKQDEAARFAGRLQEAVQVAQSQVPSRRN